MPFKNQHPLYHVWRAMRDRCKNPNNRQWNDYGGRGIKICERWDDFKTFVSDMGERPPNHSLDRVDNDGDYTPENCRWASRKTQQRNRRNAVFVEVEGRRYRAVELAERAGIKTDTIIERAKRGLPLEKVLSTKKLLDVSGLARGGQASGAAKQAATHCVNGHPYDEANTSITKQGWRRCRACHRKRARTARLKAAE